MSIEYLKRDDINMEIIEEIQKRYPGMKLIFPGQNPEALSEDAKRLIEKFNKEQERKLVLGLCVDCEKKIPGVWPPVIEDGEDGCDLPDGWAYFTDQTDQISAIQCDECNRKEKETE